MASEEEWRREGVGGSDISKIYNMQWYSTSNLLLEKAHGKVSTETNEAMRRGVRLEPVARKWIEFHYDITIPPICVESEDNPLHRVSLDGYDFDSKTVWEIKCPSSESVINACRKATEVDDFPQEWIYQVQWQLMCTKASTGFLAIWDAENQRCIIKELFYDTKLIQKMKDKADRFLEKVEYAKASFELAPIPFASEKKKKKEEIKKKAFIKGAESRGKFTPDNILENLNIDKFQESSSTNSLFKIYTELKAVEKIIRHHEESIRSVLIPRADGEDLITETHTMVRRTPTARYDVKRMLEDGLDLSSYKLPTKATYYIRPKGKKINYEDELECFK